MCYSAAQIPLFEYKGRMYVRVGVGKMKLPTGEWVRSVVYRSVDTLELYSCSAERWEEKFKLVCMVPTS